MNLKQFISPIHKEGYIFVIISAAATFLIASIFSSLGWIGLIITLYIAYFFRDPKRYSPTEENAIIAPADGVIQKIEEAHAPEELNLGNNKYTRISIFLNIFNVHVNRIPIAGKIIDLHYRSGKFLNASLDKASQENERQSCIVETKSGTQIIFVQIAGLIAKRIICDLDLEQEVKSGERFGLIRFGSRMDIYIPSNAQINVIEGQTSIGGETILAKLKKASSKPASGNKKTTKIAKTTKTKKPTKTKKEPQKNK